MNPFITAALFLFVYPTVLHAEWILQLTLVTPNHGTQLITTTGRFLRTSATPYNEHFSGSTHIFHTPPNHCFELPHYPTNDWQYYTQSVASQQRIYRDGDMGTNHPNDQEEQEEEKKATSPKPAKIIKAVFQPSVSVKSFIMYQDQSCTGHSQEYSYGWDDDDDDDTDDNDNGKDSNVGHDGRSRKSTRWLWKMRNRKDKVFRSYRVKEAFAQTSFADTGGGGSGDVNGMDYGGDGRSEEERRREAMLAKRRGTWESVDGGFLS